MLNTTRALQAYQVMRLGSVVLTSILLAKSGMSMSEIGTWEALLYLGSVAAFFWANGLLQGIPTVYARLDPNARSALIFNVFILFTAIALVVVSVLWAGRLWAVPALAGLERVPFLGWFGLYLFFNLATLPVEYVYMLREKPVALLGWGSVSFGLYVVALVAPVLSGFGLKGGIICLAGLGLLRFVWAIVLAVRYGSSTWRPDLLRQYLQFSMPLVFNLLVGSLVLLFDNWLVGWYFQDEAIFAVFRYGSREFPVATALATALGTAMVLQIATSETSGLAELRHKTRRLFHLLFPMTILLLCFSEKLFPVVFNPEFAAAAPLFNIYLLLTASRVLLPNTVVLAKGHSQAILAVGLIELALKVVLGFLFIHWWGLVGVAWSAVAAFFWEKIALIWYLEKRLNVRTGDWLDVRLYTVYVAALFLAWALTR